MSDKPRVSSDVNGNIFSVVAAAAKSLRRAGQGDKASEMQERVFQAGSYEQALAIILEYVEFD